VLTSRGSRRDSRAGVEAEQLQVEGGRNGLSTAIERSDLICRAGDVSDVEREPQALSGRVHGPRGEPAAVAERLTARQGDSGGGAQSPGLPGGVRLRGKGWPGVCATGRPNPNRVELCSLTWREKAFQLRSGAETRSCPGSMGDGVAIGAEASG